jgi:hypothetical protein
MSTTNIIIIVVAVIAVIAILGVRARGMPVTRVERRPPPDERMDID